MTENVWNTTKFDSLEYGMYAGIPDISPVVNQSRVEVRQSGKTYQYFSSRIINLNGSLSDVMTLLATSTADMSDVEISNKHEAVGGGMGHYDYDVVTRITGWIDMTPEQVKAFKTLKYNVNSFRKVEMEIKRLRKMIDSMGKAKRKGLF